MRSVRSVAFARWVLEHLTFGSDNEALAGDLLEQFQLGRSTGWFWRQAVIAITVRAWGSAREFILVIIFSAVWSMLYPAWRLVAANHFPHAIADQWEGFVWPYSALADLNYGVVPCIAFVWAGFALYLLFRPELWNRMSAYRSLLGLSQSLTALLVETALLLHHLKHPQMDLAQVRDGDFYSVFHLGSISIPIALSLAVGLFSRHRDPPRMVRRRRSSRSVNARRMRRVGQTLCLTFLLCLYGSAQTTSPTAATVQFVTVDQDVKLEVLDWGGTGRPLVFLAGLGNDAHVYEKFAPRFTTEYHVYGITRRGFGASSKPVPANDNYSADRLGDDVLAVLKALDLNQPVLVGHSLAGEELSSIGSRHPERVAGLIYLDAGYGYAFYDRAHGDDIFDFFELQKRLDAFMSGRVRNDQQFMEDFATSISRLDRDLKEFQERNASMRVLHAPHAPVPPIIKAINLGGQEYTDIRVPVLAIFACPHNLDFDPSLRDDPKAKAAAVADNLFYTSRQADAFQAGIPSARVVRLPNAEHYIFRSNEGDVVREMDAFLATLH